MQNNCNVERLPVYAMSKAATCPQSRRRCLPVSVVEGEATLEAAASIVEGGATLEAAAPIVEGREGLLRPRRPSLRGRGDSCVDGRPVSRPGRSLRDRCSVAV